METETAQRLAAEEYFSERAYEAAAEIGMDADLADEFICALVSKGYGFVPLPSP